MHMFVVESDSSMQEPVKNVIRSMHPTLTDGKSLVSLNADFISRHRTSLDHLISGECLLPCLMEIIYSWNCAIVNVFTFLSFSFFFLSFSFSFSGFLFLSSTTSVQGVLQTTASLS